MPNYTHIKGVYINTPCHEDWDAMTEAERGRYCNQCATVVYDFTNATPEEFFKAYRENKGKICGLFSAPQLGFWPTQKNRLVQLLRQSKAAIVAIGLGLFSYKSNNAHTLSAPQNIVADADNEFVQLSFEIRDSYTNKIVKQDFKVTIIYNEYEIVINKVSDGIVVFEIPKEFVNTQATIIIEGDGIDKTSVDWRKSEIKTEVKVAASKKAKKSEEQRNRYRRKTRRMGCPDF